MPVAEDHLMILQAFSISASQGLLMPHRGVHGGPTAGEMAGGKDSRGRELLLVPVEVPVESATTQMTELGKGVVTELQKFE